MEKPVLAIMAAGIGSRYGGLKQIDPVGAHGELIIDYSIYDAVKAGFEKVVFIINHKIEKDFRETIGDRTAKNVEVAYAYQELDLLPSGYSVPEGRGKPWGTTHALLAARELLGGPFAVINADDYYGPAAFKTIHEWLSLPQPQDGKSENGMLHYAMVGYRIENTLSDHGSVTRGICEADGDGFLCSVTERAMIEKTPQGARYSEDKGETWTALPGKTLVSMNCWGLNEGFLKAAERDFSIFLDKNIPENPLKCEFLLPSEINDQVQRSVADVKVLESGDVWYGVTYKEDKAVVTEAMAAKHKQGIYPTPLWR